MSENDFFSENTIPFSHTYLDALCMIFLFCLCGKEIIRRENVAVTPWCATSLAKVNSLMLILVVFS